METSTPRQFELFSTKGLSENGKKISMPVRFLIFDALNPWVYREIKKRALEVAGFSKKVGMKSIIEDIRWHVWRLTEGQECFKINNSFAPYYTRTLLIDEPQLRGVIEVRKMKIEFNYIEKRVLYGEIIKKAILNKAGKSAK